MDTFGTSAIKSLFPINKDVSLNVNHATTGTILMLCDNYSISQSHSSNFKDLAIFFKF